MERFRKKKKALRIKSWRKEIRDVAKLISLIEIYIINFEIPKNQRNFAELYRKDNNIWIEKNGVSRLISLLDAVLWYKIHSYVSLNYDKSHNLKIHNLHEYNVRCYIEISLSYRDSQPVVKLEDKD